MCVGIYGDVDEYDGRWTGFYVGVYEKVSSSIGLYVGVDVCDVF